jgi:hypothetical protein
MPVTTPKQGIIDEDFAPDDVSRAAGPERLLHAF